MIKIGIIGATGYAGVELIRILLNHPQAELAAVSSVSFEGKAVSEVYPSLYGLCDLPCCSAQEAIEKSDVIFACVQHGISQEFAAQCAEKDVAFIDLGADFRLKEESDYAQWYGGAYTHQELHSQAVYALPELFRAEIQKARILANPGCYPTSVALGLAPALREGLIEPQGIVIDSKSGVTGSGRSPVRRRIFLIAMRRSPLIRLRRTATRRRSSRRSPAWPVKSSRLCLCRTCCRSTGGLSLRCMPA